jgi:DNA-binding HxlR family transcriptional regulator
MTASKSAGRVRTSCNKKGTWAASSPSDVPTVCGDRAIPNEDPLERIEGRWTLQILLCLATREHRFADLRAAIPRISANILTDRLRTLECAGLVERDYLPSPHASHVYMLTKLAIGLRPALGALARWRAANDRFQ